MHILFFSDNFPPEVNAPASRTFEHCRHWVERGHQVTVITCAPNAPRGVLLGGYRNRLWQEERMGGVRVIRVWTYIAPNAGHARRILDYLSYMVAASLAAPFVRGVDVVVGTSPQLFTACAAWLAGALRRVPYVFELRDLWPESIKAVGAMRPSAVLRLLEKLELFLYRRAALIVSVTAAFRADLARRGIDPAKVAIVTNGIDLDRFRPMAKDEALVRHHGLEGKFVAGYVGTHGMAHGLDTVLAAAGLLKRSPDGDGIRLLMIGDGAEKRALIDAADALALDNLRFIDTVPRADVARYWSLLDVAIIHLRRSPLFELVIPSKMFEAMGMGIPIVLGVKGEAADILARAEAGIAIEPEDAEALCRALISLKEDRRLHRRLSNRARAAAANFDRTRLAGEMLELLEGLVAEREPASSRPPDPRNSRS